MPALEGCKHSLEIEVPVDQVKAESDRVVVEIQKGPASPVSAPAKRP